jgi:hypothetical protein
MTLTMLYDGNRTRYTVTAAFGGTWYEGSGRTIATALAELEDVVEDAARDAYREGGDRVYEIRWEETR